MASVQYLGENKYKVTISAGFDGNGKRKRIYKNIEAKSEAAAKKKANTLETEVVKGEYTAPSKFTFAEYVEEWKKKAERELAPKTLYGYYENLKNHIIPHIGNVKLENLTPIMIENLYDDLRKPQKREYTRKDGLKRVREYTLSEMTIKHMHRLISTILQQAFKKGIIKENPSVRVDAPKVKKQEPKCYDEDNIAALIEALEDADLDFKTCIHIALAGGLRLGEIMGLEWSDVDEKTNTITIRQSSQYVPGKGTFTKDPKNETSKRMVTLPKPVIDLINELEHDQKIRKIALGNKWKESNRLFTMATGEPMHPYSPSKWFKAFLKEKGLPPLTVHQLRHTSASYLIAQGEDVVTVAKRLGHSNSNTTLSIYAHSFRKRDEGAANKMAGMYASKKENDVKAN